MNDSEKNLIDTYAQLVQDNLISKDELNDILDASDNELLDVALEKLQEKMTYTFTTTSANSWPVTTAASSATIYNTFNTAYTTFNTAGTSSSTQVGITIKAPVGGSEGWKFADGYEFSSGYISRHYSPYKCSKKERTIQEYKDQDKK